MAKIPKTAKKSGFGDPWETPRGVDVKPLARRGSGTPETRFPGPRPPGEAWEAPEGSHPGSRDRGPWSREVPGGPGRPRETPSGLPAPSPGVDVKPLRGEAPEGPKSPKIPQNGVLWPKTPFFGILAKNSHFWPLFRKIAR